MCGKDLIGSVDVASKVCKVLGWKEPENLVFMQKFYVKSSYLLLEFRSMVVTRDRRNLTGSK